MKDAKGHGSDPRGAHNAGVDQVGKWTNPSVSFSPAFKKALDDAALLSANQQGRINPTDAGTVRDALSPKLVGHLPDAVQDAKIKFASNVNGEPFRGFGTSVVGGKHVIVMHPEQPAADYVRGLVHEVQHIADKVAGRKVAGNLDLSKSNYSKYRNQAAEKRARLAEETGKILYTPKAKTK